MASSTHGRLTYLQSNPDCHSATASFLPYISYGGRAADSAKTVALLRDFQPLLGVAWLPRDAGAGYPRSVGARKTCLCPGARLSHRFFPPCPDRRSLCGRTAILQRRGCPSITPRERAPLELEPARFGDSAHR